MPTVWCRPAGLRVLVYWLEPHHLSCVVTFKKHKLQLPIWVSFKCSENLKAYGVMCFWIFNLFLILYSGSGYPLTSTLFYVFIGFFKPFSVVSQKLISSIYVLFNWITEYSNKWNWHQKDCGQTQLTLGKHEAQWWDQKCPSVLGSGLKSRCGPWSGWFTFGVENLGPCGDP